ncbi:MAG: hypothetical protein EXQ92_06745, partial [Alphaproteobacteria bacterium]|nr:hypothetical protein [Alphaproteobacteria bacterium]
MTIAQEIATFCRRSEAMPLATEIGARARLCLADHLHAAMHGVRSETGGLMTRYLGSSGIASGKEASAEATALFLGTTAAVHEIDDVHQDTSMHPGAVVIAAALALTTEEPVTGRRLLTALTVGYEVAIRLSIAAGHRHYHFFHATATCGALGAAAAAAIILGLDEERTAHALAIAATSASGLWEDINDTAVGIKHLHPGFAAERGVRAAKLARLGLRGAARSIEGEKGFLAALAQPGAHAPGEVAPTGEALREILLGGLGARWAILRNIFKRYPFCLGCFEPLEGIRHIVAETAGRVDDIAAVRVEMCPPTASLVEQANPRDQFQAKFSAPFALALVLAGYDPERVPLPAEWLIEPTVRRWYPLVQVVGSASIPRRRAVVTVTRRDGSRNRTDRPFRNLDEAQVWARFAAACRQYLGARGPLLEERVARCAALSDAG